MPYKEQIQRAVEAIRVTEDMMPGVIVIHDVRDWAVVYISRKGREQLQIGEDEYHKLNIGEFHNRYFNPEDAALYLPRLLSYMKRNEENEVLSFFQQVRIAPLKDWIWHMSATRVLMRDAEGMPLLTITFSAPVDSENEITLKMKQVLRENNFIRNNIPRYNALGKREREILKLLSQGKNTAEIAAELFISAHTVNTHRKNIKLKLGVAGAHELREFARVFNLI